MISLCRGSVLKPISKTVNEKTGTVVKKFTFLPDGNSNILGLSKKIEYGSNTALKKMGIDKVSITKVPGQKSLIKFFQEKGGVTRGISFLQGAPEIKTFVNMLKECASKGGKLDISTAKALFKVLK